MQKTDEEEISIHAPRTGSDYQEALDIATERLFQSTLPARGATLTRQESRNATTFQSTLPARGATSSNRALQTMRHFNPRSPHGERPKHGSTRIPGENISIHAPRTGSDGARPEGGHHEAISIHAPRTGSDSVSGLRGWSLTISIHAPRTGSDHAAGRQPV